MDKVKYTTRTGKQQWKPVLSEKQVYKSVYDDMIGFCLSCGQIRDCCEPDAERYECDSCGEKKVYGLFSLAMMDLVVIK